MKAKSTRKSKITERGDKISKPMNSDKNVEIEPISLMDVRFLDPHGWYVEYLFSATATQVDLAFQNRFGQKPVQMFRLFPDRSIFAGPAPDPGWGK